MLGLDDTSSSRERWVDPLRRASVEQDLGDPKMVVELDRGDLGSLNSGQALFPQLFRTDDLPLSFEQTGFEVLREVVELPATRPSEQGPRCAKEFTGQLLFFGRALDMG
jgi:hypothetical protein